MFLISNPNLPLLELEAITSHTIASRSRGQTHLTPTFQELWGAARPPLSLLCSRPTHPTPSATPHSTVAPDPSSSAAPLWTHSWPPTSF